MAYTKKTWVDVPDPSNPPDIPEGQDALARFDAENMNRIEEGIASHIADNVVHNNTRGGGGAVGLGANTSPYGGSVGYNATSKNGGAVGSGANVENGGAVGNGARATNGGALGYNARTSLGAAIGSNAQTVNALGNVIDAVQLGSGTNKEEKTLQVYDKKLLNADGTIPAERMPSKAPVGHGLGTISTTYREDFMDAIKRGGGSYTLGNAEDSPTEYNSWLSLLQLVRDIGDGTETGSQLAFRDYNISNPQMWLRAIINGVAGNWYEILHTGNTTRTQLASYVGTGTWGANNPCSLTFDFVPKIIMYIGNHAGFLSQLGYDNKYGIMFCEGLPTEYNNTQMNNFGFSSEEGANRRMAKKSPDGKTVYWYADYSDSVSEGGRYQLNMSGYTYNFIAIG